LRGDVGRRAPLQAGHLQRLGGRKIRPGLERAIAPGEEGHGKPVRQLDDRRQAFKAELLVDDPLELLRTHESRADDLRFAGRRREDRMDGIAVVTGNRADDDAAVQLLLQHGPEEIERRRGHGERAQGLDEHERFELRRQCSPGRQQAGGQAIAT
jgi:hypothetical protein